MNEIHRLTRVSSRLAKLGGVWPISESKAPIAHVEICGHQWEVHFGYNHGGAMKVYSFLPVNGPIQHFNADVKQFFNFLSHQFQFPQHNQYMLGKSLPRPACRATRTPG